MAHDVTEVVEIEKRRLRVGFHTFGCRSNYADTTDIEALCVERGAFPCSVNEDADVYVVNTCTVTDAADRDAFRMLRRIKKHHPQSRVVVTGCLASTRARRLLDSQLVDAVVPAGEKRAVIEAIFGRTQLLPQLRPEPLRESPLEPLPVRIPRPGETFGEAGTGLQSRHRFHLRVQEGCENHCTFCIIPTARGRLRSRPVRGVLEDIERLIVLGYEEIVLTGTHLGGYGSDIGSSLSELLRELNRGNFPARFRLSSIDPNDVTIPVIEELAASDIFCPHLHICIQSFSDAVLKLMNRRYRMKTVASLLERVVVALPGCCVGGDLIVGFPGERREDVEEGIERFLGLPISYLHVFPYSEREATAAMRLPGTVPVAERKRRAERFRALGERRRVEFYRSLVGRELEVIFEHDTPRGVYGVSREFARVFRASGGNGEHRRGDGGEEKKAPSGREIGEERRGVRVRVRITGVDEGERVLRCV